MKARKCNIMNKIDAQSWKADMPDFREKTKAFYNGEMRDRKSVV